MVQVYVYEVILTDVTFFLVSWKQVVSIEQLHLIVQVSKTMQGHVHITQASYPHDRGLQNEALG